MEKSVKPFELTGKKLFLLTLPQLGLMMCHFLVSMADMWAAGKIGPDVQASIGIVSQVFIFLVIIVSVASGGSMAAISQSLGLGDVLRARRYVGLVLVLSSCLGVLTTLVFGIILYISITMYQISDNLKIFALAYIFHLFFFYTLTVMNTIFRAYGLVNIPFITTFIILVCNLAGNMLFGLGYFGFPAFGSSGIAWSTFFSSVVGFLFNLFMIRRVGILRRDSFAPFKWQRAAAPYLFSVSIPSAISQLASSTAGLALLWLIGSIPTNTQAAIAGFTLGMRIETIVLFPISAFAVTMSMVSGRLLGSGHSRELYNFGRRVSYGVAFSVAIISLILFLLKDVLLGFFSHDSETIHNATLYMAVACLMLPLRGYTSIASSLFAGTGATVLSCKISIFTAWGIQIPLSWLLVSKYDLGLQGIFTSMAAAWILSFVCYIMVYRRKTWLNYGLCKTTS